MVEQVDTKDFDKTNFSVKNHSSRNRIKVLSAQKETFDVEAG